MMTDFWHGIHPARYYRRRHNRRSPGEMHFAILDIWREHTMVIFFS